MQVVECGGDGDDTAGGAIVDFKDNCALAAEGDIGWMG